MSVIEQNEVATLYALRGGLSVVSAERDRIDGILFEATDKKDALINSANEKIKSEESNLTGLQIELQNKLSQLDQYKNTIAGEEKARKQLRRHRFLYWFTLFWTVFLSGLFFIGCCLIDTLENKSDDVTDDKKTIKNINDLKKQLPVLTSEIASLERLCLLSENKLAELRNDLVVAEQDGLAILKNAQKSVEPDVNAMKDYITNLETSYGETLDIRDWTNLDLVIFAIETRRADNIKEALVYVDGEVRTGRIEHAVYSASKEICISIETGLQRLHGSINQSFSALSDNISRTMSKAIDSNSAKMNELINVQRLNNALLEKSATSSIELAEDVKALRNNSDYANWRLLNN